MPDVIARPHARRRPGLRARLRRLLGLLALRRTRARLGTLDDHLLRDIGITRAQAEREASRPPWDVPDHWRS